MTSELLTTSSEESAATDEPLSPPVNSRKRSIPCGFTLSDSGLFYRDPDPDSDKPSVWVCGRLNVLAMTRDSGGESWGRLLMWHDADGRRHTFALSLSMLAGDGNELVARLLDGGLNVSHNRKAREALIRYVQESEPECRARCTSQVGWHGDSFVLSDVTIGDAQEEVIFQGEGESLLRQSGTLEEWKESVGRNCVGNSRLTFVVSVALAGPILRPCDEQSGGFHYVGVSSTGKSTALGVAGSVQGGGGKMGFCQSWRATANGLESVAEAHNDLTVILDEMSQCDPKEAGEVAYMLANGMGKNRMRAAGGLRRKPSWHLLFLSAGEITLGDHIRGIGQKTRGGQEVRLLNIPADAGVGLGLFEDLHGFQSSDTFARHLQDASRRIYGTPIRAYLKFVTGNLEFVRQMVPTYRQEFIAANVTENASGEVSRAAGRFALVGAAGEIGIMAEVLPWQPGSAMDAAERLFKEWVAARGTVGATDAETAIRQVRQFIEQHGDSRFEQENDARTITNRAGYYRQGTDGRREYWCFQETFRTEICKGYDVQFVARALADRRYLIPGGKDRFISRRRIGPAADPDDDNRISVYVVREAILR
jgi:putative DNA primase/helicase